MNNQSTIKIWYRNEICDKYDWRIKYIWNLEEELKKVPWNERTHDWDNWSVFIFDTNFLFDKNKISITMPEMTALYLNISNKNYLSSRKYISNFNKDKTTWYVHLEEEAFNYLEDIIVAIVFAISVLEVFFNQLLLDKDRNVILWVEKMKDWKERSLKVEDIEWLSLEIKITEILPIMFDLKDVNLEKIISQFKALNKLRNDIIHLKSKDLKQNINIKNIILWKRIFDQSKKNPSTTSINIIKFFYENSWIELPRYLRLSPL